MVLVTGGTGLLGSHLLVELSKRNIQIRAIKRNHSDLSEVQSVFKYYLGDVAEDSFSKINWVIADLLDIPALEDAIEGCTEIYHCAGFVSFTKKDFQKLMKINKEGTANLVNIAISKGIAKFCHVSSTAAIGRQTITDQYDENSKWVSSPENSNYAVSKYSAEMEVWRGIEEGLDSVIVNPSVIFGAGSWNEGSMTIFKTVKEGLKFYTPGKNAFVDARDVAFIMAELMAKSISRERFLTIGENLSFKSLFDNIALELNVKQPKTLVNKTMANIAWRIEHFRSLILNKKPRITRETTRSAFSSSIYDNSKIQKAIGFKFTPISDSIKNAIKYNQRKS